MNQLSGRWIFSAVVVGFLSVGCGGSRLPDPQAVQNRIALTAFGGPNACSDLERYIEDTAVLQMRAHLEGLKSEQHFWMEGDRAMATGAAAETKGTAGPSAYTTTNTQVAGVDEADFVKNDGERIFVLSGRTLYTTRSWPASQLALQGKLELEGYPREMFLDEQDRLVVFSSVYRRRPQAEGPERCDELGCGYYSANAVKVTVVNVADLAQPTVTQQFYLSGHYANSRRVGSSVRLVLSDRFQFPQEVRWYPQSDDPRLWEDKSRLAGVLDKLMEANERSIRAQDLDGWLPQSLFLRADGTQVSIPRDCTGFHKSNAPTELGLLTIATLNLDHPTEMNATSVVARVGEVYASQSHLYVANHHWWWRTASGQRDATYLHKFDLTDPDRARYVASGTVPGHIVNQFSMDESASGHFRIATTIRRWEEDADRRFRVDTTNQLFVLGENEGRLEVVGQSEELAQGERIFSARFVGDQGYVVTFRQVDPLFTFDLSDPTQPRKVGELKIPGFSTYIHPLDEGHLLTIGTFVPENPTDPMERSLQLSIFDVTDLANPKQTFTQKVGTAYGWSEAQYEHKAFNYFAARKLLAIPFFDWSPRALSTSDYWSSFRSELKVYEVDAHQGFVSRGALRMDDLYRTQNTEWGWYGWWQPMVRRSVMADQFVYAISDAGIRVADVAQLDSPLAEVRFQRASTHTR